MHDTIKFSKMTYRDNPSTKIPGYKLIVSYQEPHDSMKNLPSLKKYLNKFSRSLNLQNYIKNTKNLNLNLPRYIRSLNSRIGLSIQSEKSLVQNSYVGNRNKLEKSKDTPKRLESIPKKSPLFKFSMKNLMTKLLKNQNSV